VGVGFVVRMGDRFVWRCQEEGIESWEDFAIDLLGRKKKGGVSSRSDTTWK
jgi:hypothetical protein